MEHEIRKHTQNILTQIGDRKKSIFRKLGEIGIEIIIIVFAVSFAVFVEKRKERNHEQREVKEFLLGLKKDLQNDIHEMEQDRSNYIEHGKNFTYFCFEKNPNPDSLKKYEPAIWNTVFLVVNNGRYEGFKSSGKINTIHNVELRNHILDLYQEMMVALTTTTNVYNNLKLDFQDLLLQRRRRAERTGDNLFELLQLDLIRNYCLDLRYTTGVVKRYDDAIAQARLIVSMINKEYSLD